MSKYIKQFLILFLIIFIVSFNTGILTMLGGMLIKNHIDRKNYNSNDEYMNKYAFWSGFVGYVILILFTFLLSCIFLLLR